MSGCGPLQERSTFLACGHRVCNTCTNKFALYSSNFCTLDKEDGPHGEVLRTDVAHEGNNVTQVTCRDQRKGGGAVHSALEMCRLCPCYCEHSVIFPENARRQLQEFCEPGGEILADTPANMLPLLQNPADRRNGLPITTEDFLDRFPKSLHETYKPVMQSGTPIEEVNPISTVSASRLEIENLNTSSKDSKTKTVSTNLRAATTPLDKQNSCVNELIDVIARANKQIWKKLGHNKKEDKEFLTPYTEPEICCERSVPEMIVIKDVGNSIIKMCTIAEGLPSTTSLLSRDGNPDYGQTGGLSQTYFHPFEGNHTTTHSHLLVRHCDLTGMRRRITVPMDPFEIALNAFIRHMKKEKKTYQWVVDRYLDSKIRTWAGGEYTCWSTSVHIAGHYLTPGATFYKGPLSGGRLVLRFTFKLQMEITDKELHWPFQRIKQVIIHPDRPFEHKMVQKFFSDELGTPPLKGPRYLQLPSNDCYCTAELERGGYIKNDLIVLRFELLPI